MTIGNLAILIAALQLARAYAVADAFPRGHQPFLANQAAGALIDRKVQERVEARDPFVQVFILLKNQPHREVLERYERPAKLRLEMLESRAAAASQRSEAEAAQARAELEAALAEVRRLAMDEIRGAITPEQDAVENLIRQLGGRNIRRYTVINMLAAELPAGAIPLLSADPAVLEIGLVETNSAQLEKSVPALGATVFWSAGYRGEGEAVAVLDSGLRAEHPAFSGVPVTSNVFLEAGKNDPCFGDNASSALDYAGHGTAVAGVVASRGTALRSSYLGVTPALGTLYNLKVGYFNSCDQQAHSYTSDVVAAIEWAVQQGIKVFNYSYGSRASADDEFWIRTLDYLADVWGLTLVVAAGNYGPDARTVTNWAIAYNLVSVGNIDIAGTVERNDDVIHSSSSRGPSPGERKKPDLSAPGTNIWTPSHQSNGFVPFTGTSFAAPHIAGAAALLRQAGVRDPLAIKALLLNTTDQLTWSNDKGWGYANLARAWEHRGRTVTSTVAYGSYKFFRASNPSLLYATLVWNRRVFSQYGTGNCLSDLDLRLYNGTTNAWLDSSASPRDNVEKAYTFTTGEVVVKASYWSGGFCAPEERFAIAASSALTAATGPSISVGCTGPTAVAPGEQFTVTCTARNQGDLRAFGVHGALNWAGQTGGADQYYGNLGPGGQASKSWAVTAPASPGSYTLKADVSSLSFGETFFAEANFVFRVNATPAPVQVTPAYGTGNSQVFTFNFADADGWQDLGVVNVLINFWLDGRQACYIAYVPATRSLYLVDDSGNAGGPYQWMTLPSSGLIGNSQCTIYGSGSSATGSGATLTLGLNIAFQPGLAGTRLVYMAARDNAGANSGWQRMGVWNVPGLPATSPAVVSVSPQRGSGRGPQAFTFQFYDADGYQDLNVLNILVNDWLDGRQACYLAFVRPLNGIYLVNDAGNALLPLLPLGGVGTVQNSQCTVYATGSSVSGSGNNLTLTLNLAFKVGFAGNRVFYVAARDAVEHNSGWQAMGTWTVP
jgi:subtilisin family serine protease